MKTSLLTLTLLAAAPTAWAADAPASRFAATVGYASQSVGGDSLVPVQLGNSYPVGSEVENSDDGGAATVGLSWYVTPHVAIELWGATGAKSDVEIDVENGPDVGVASYRTRPLALSVQYHFVDLFEVAQVRISPFVGVGYHHTEVSSVRSNSALPAYNGLAVDSGGGLALSAGIDVAMGERWFLRGDVRRLTWSSESTVNGQPLAKGDMDATLFGASLGVRF